MKIAVLVKIVDGELNIFDQSALESALSIDNGDVTVLSMGPENTAGRLQSLTRLGVKRVILLSDKMFAGSDTLATSYVLAKALKKLDYDIIICGRQTTDGDTAQVGPCTAAMLGIPPVTNVMEFNIKDGTADCITRLGEERVELPALLTLERINTLRFPSIRSRLGEIEIWNGSDLNADPERCGLDGSPTRVLKVFEKTNDRRKCRFISISELGDIIKESLAKQAFSPKNSICEKKLKNVWVVGEAVKERAEEIAETVTVIESDNPYEIVALAEKEKPSVILWNADLWGRKNAPVVSAILKTGLCADCTELKTDGEKLYMYRPARSGNVTAKIECRTLPQMATVRTLAPSDEIIVSCGRGGREYFEKVKLFAETIGAEVGASRGLVDSKAAPYEMQVGITGKTVSPKVYVAIGISGAVHHTAAIENAGTVIAINPDKNARIFDYADYGIAADGEKVIDMFVK